MAESFIPTKDKSSVTILLGDGETLEGSLFIPSHDRLVDMLNDERMFLPFESSEGEFLVINKSAIKTISNRKEERGLRLKAR
jgi:hypothetical protein